MSTPSIRDTNFRIDYGSPQKRGRVPIGISSNDEVAEAFTITDKETGDGGVLNLIWGEVVLSADFEIQ